MSNGTHEPNRNNNGNRNRNRNRNRPSGNNSNSNTNSNSNNRSRSNGGPQQGNGPRSQSQHQKFVSKGPAKLTLWQKVLKMFGLYKEPVKFSRNESNRPSTAPKPRFEDGSAAPKTAPTQNKAPRTNTRDARNAGEARPPRERREPSNADVESTRLYIGNLSFDANESDIEELFKGIGPVRSVEIVYNRHTHKSKGYGFVEMLRIDEAKRSVEVLHDQHFMGRQLVVSGAKAKNAEDGEERLAARERKDNTPAPAVVSAPAETVAEAVTETHAETETPAAIVEETVAVAEDASEHSATEIVEEVHSLESDTQKENFA